MQRKLLESIKLCEDITTCNLNTGQIQIAFILVTDVNVASNPLNVLTQQLNMLAFTTSSWEKVCTSALKATGYTDSGTQNLFYRLQRFRCTDVATIK